MTVTLLRGEEKEALTFQHKSKDSAKRRVYSLMDLHNILWQDVEEDEHGNFILDASWWYTKKGN